jgi:hypothetical protein
MKTEYRSALTGLALMALVALVAGPAFAADPSPSAGASERPDKPAETEKTKVAELPITITGTVATSTDSDGDATFTLRSGGTTYTLDGGPAWFHGANHPLKAYVGKSVTVVGEREPGSTEVDVQTVDGKAIRAPGKPPWAGGWKVVGKLHPGWSQAKADKFEAKFGDCFPPGKCKVKPAKAAATPTP